MAPRGTANEGGSRIMGASVFEARVDRAVAEVRRAARAGLDGTEILQRTAAAIHTVAPIDAFCASTADPGSLLMTGGVARGMDAHVPDVGRVSRRFFERVYFQEQLHLVRLMLRRGESVVTPAEALGVPATETLRYREVLHPIGMAPEAALIFADDGFRGGMEVMRGSDAPPFSARELDAMRRIAPEVGRGLRAAALRTQAAVPESAARPGGDTPGVLVVDVGGDVVSATPAARALLAELARPTPDWLEHGPLPTPVMMALGDLARRCDRVRPGGPVGPRRGLRVMSRRGQWLTIHADLAEGRDGLAGDRVVVIAPTPAAEVAWMRLSGSGLSPPRGGGRAPGGGRLVHEADRGTAVHRRTHGAASSQQHLRQGRRALPPRPGQAGVHGAGRPVLRSRRQSIVTPPARCGAAVATTRRRCLVIPDAPWDPIAPRATPGMTRCRAG
jgi:hypothetical protein